MNAPLADQMRPQTIDEVVGQSHILSKNGILYRIAQSGHATNLIFYGPPGTGKTTVARIIAKQAGKKLYKLNGTTASTADFKEIISSLDTFEGMNGVVLYLDEIQYLNKIHIFIFITLSSPEALSLNLSQLLRKKSKRLLPAV